MFWVSAVFCCSDSVAELVLSESTVGFVEAVSISTVKPSSKGVGKEASSAEGRAAATLGFFLGGGGGDSLGLKKSLLLIEEAKEAFII
jgi:hypothetical protein